MYPYLKTLLIIFLVCFCSYFNILKDPFQFDGVRYIKENPYIIGLVEKQDYTSFFFEYSPSNIFNRPFLNYTYAFNYYLGKEQTLGYHLINLLIHFSNCLLLYLISLKTIKIWQVRGNSLIFNMNTPLACALLFASHPAQTQTVTYIISRSASLSAFLYLCSLYCFIIAFTERSKQNRRNNLSFWGFLLLSLLFMRLGLGVKLTIVSLPATLLAYYFLFIYQPKSGYQGLNKALLIVITAIIIIVTLAVIGDVFMGLNDLGMKVYGRLNYFYSQITWFVFYYLKIWFFPFNLGIDPDVRMVSKVSDPGLISAIVVLCLLFTLLARQSRLSCFGFLLMTLSFAPESSFVPLLDIVAEQRLYLPATGFILGMTAILSARKWVPLYAVLIICFTINTAHRNKDWISEKALWKDTVEKSPNKWRPYSNYARALELAGDSEQALTYYIKAIQLEPDHFELHHNLGNVYVSLQHCDLAIDEYSKALTLKSDVAETHVGIGKCSKALGNYVNAVSSFKQALEINPDMDSVYREIGSIYYFNLDDKQTAAFYLQQAVRLNPNHASNPIILNMIKE